MLATHRSASLSSRHPPSSYPLSPQNSPPHPATSSTMSFKPSHNSKRPSLTSPMSWLTRSSSSASSQTLHTQSVPAAKPVRISEPKVKVSMPHVGGLGFGATVVRTPDDALAGSGVRVEHGSDEHLEQPEQQRQSCIDEESETEDSSEEIYDEYLDNSIRPATPPETPPRSSLPLSKSSPTLPLKETPVPARPTRPPPPPPASSEPSIRSSLKTPSPPVSAMFPPVPPLPARPSWCSPPPPPFDCILLSPLPTTPIDMSKVLVTVETSTLAQKTTLGTLASRPSHLARYLKSLFANKSEISLIASESDGASLYSRNSQYSEAQDFHSLFQDHLASSGVLPRVSSHVHIFLDRPSAPYEHILAYLRSPPSTDDAPAALPHAVQLHTYSTARVEALVALRDEARFLGLDELVRLCTAELRARQPRASALHMRGLSSTSSGSAGSARSTGTLRDRDSGERTLVADRDSGERTLVADRESLGSFKSARTSPVDAPKLAARGRSPDAALSLRSPRRTNWL